MDILVLRYKEDKGKDKGKDFRTKFTRLETFEMPYEDIDDDENRNQNRGRIATESRTLTPTIIVWTRSLGYSTGSISINPFVYKSFTFPEIGQILERFQPKRVFGHGRLRIYGHCDVPPTYLHPSHTFSSVTTLLIGRACTQAEIMKSYKRCSNLLSHCRVSSTSRLNWPTSPLCRSVRTSHTTFSGFPVPSLVTSFTLKLPNCDLSSFRGSSPGGPEAFIAKFLRALHLPRLEHFSAIVECGISGPSGRKSKLDGIVQ